MLRFTWKSLRAQKLRLVMTALSITLGVAFMSGTMVLSDALNESFSKAAGQQYEGVDVVVRAHSDEAEDTDSRATVSAEILTRIRAIPGVGAAEGKVVGYALIIGPDGKTVGAGAQANRGMSVGTDAVLNSGVSYREGTAPSESGQVAVDAATARSANIKVGDRIGVVSSGAPTDVEVSGVALFGGQESLGSTTTALFALSTAQTVMGKDGFDEIRVRSSAGTSAESLIQALVHALPPGLDVETRAAAAEQAAETAKKDVSVISTFLFAFALVALFVGSFIIWNTFSIVVAQRSRQLALLRAIGATRRQLLRSVLLESVTVGFVASALGLVTGLLTARSLVQIMRALAGIEMSVPDAHLRPTTVWVALAAGTAVTVGASWAPARRATRVEPIEALREATPRFYRPSLRRVTLGTISTTAGLALLVGGGSSHAAPRWVAIGSGLFVIGIMILLPILARRAASILGTGLAAGCGMNARLARDNVMRNPRRTSATAAALMIGLALVSSVTVVAASLKKSVGNGIERTVRADLVVQMPGGRGGVSPDLAEVLRTQPGVDDVAEYGIGSARIDGKQSSVVPIDPSSTDATLDLGVSSGAIADLASGGLLVRDSAAEAHHWHVGSLVDVTWPQGQKEQVPVAGVFTEADVVRADYLVSLQSYDSRVPGRLDTLVMLTASEGQDLSTLQRRLSTVAKAYAQPEVLTVEELRRSIAGVVDQMLMLMTALLLLAVLISLLGIVNTLALSIIERTREIGLLRAVGMTRRRIRSMVRWESALIASIGALLGTAIGITLGLAMSRSLSDQGITRITVPTPRLLVYIAMAVLASVLATLGPARRASKVDVLRAVVTE